ncbi:MAG: glutamate-1-semialdehyde 2,1-aminomutase [Candidatus Omnitrophota bacterium]|nr:glutamate-1-semialdehyde 2,1-aminomutase [Candidatus Omnitrophota bacterium]
MAEVGLAKDLLNEAKKYIPGGVNSPVRSFKAVGGYPLFVKQGNGSKIYGECEGEFIDYCLSWGALILGHAHPQVIEALGNSIKNGTSFGATTKLEIDLAKLIVEAVPSIEQVRLTNSGTEAVMSAIRLARAYTKKDKIIKFEGSYHGHADYLLVKAGSGAQTLGMPDSLGVPKDFTKHTIIAPINDIEKLERIAKEHQDSLAAIIVEPVQANCGVILPEKDFLKKLRAVASKYNILLIFDEVITGFRLSYGGAQEYFDVKPDLTCLGKIIGGGLPVGAFGGRKEIMELLAPLGGVYQAGTLSGNPIAVTLGVLTLNILKEADLYKELEKNTKEFCETIKRSAEEYKIKLKVNYIGSMFSLFFTDQDVIDYKGALRQDTELFKKFFHGLLKKGIYFSPSGFEANFLSLAHSAEDKEKTLRIVDEVLQYLRR